MYALDFEYDGQRLSDHGFVICNFGGGTSNFDTVSAGSKITFNKVSRNRGAVYSLTGTKYEECITTTFTICKDPTSNDDLLINGAECRTLMRWLNRREFLRFCFLDDQERETYYYNASFNVNKIMVNRELFGLELTMEADRPFALGPTVKESWTVSNTALPYILNDVCDEVGSICPTVKITCLEAGTMTLHNSMGDVTTVIKNCTQNEVITIHGDTQIIETSMNSHKLYRDFNFEFFRIGNTIGSRSNSITASIKCNIELSYDPIIKNSPF